MKVGAEQFAFLRDLLRRRTGVVIDDSKQYLVVARLTPIVRQRAIPSLDTLVDRIRRTGDKTLEQDVLNAMMTHETSFFRDKSPFDTLQGLIQEMIPRRSAHRQLVIWSAASSTGQEPYSIAILLNERFPALVAEWRIRIIATDISEPVLARAREGVFSDLETNRGLPPELLRKYFRALQGKWSIAQDCRKLVEFRCLNLNGPWPMLPPCDVIFLRNVMLYFDVPTRAALVARMRRVLKPDGALFLGGAETMIGIDTGYERLLGAGCSYYRPKPQALRIDQAR
ncbi:MAG: protein-glutamate O-methyltransferase CheR [Planctomycetia bacterium]|nr:protein-glutamate O-methyltransferase CheR [Planctomycetia bacterium]